MGTFSDDPARQNLMQRRLGQRTDTCFQRCEGMDAQNVHSVTFEIDRRHEYHQRLLAVLTGMQRANLVVGRAMTDVKGDRSRPPPAGR